MSPVELAHEGMQHMAAGEFDSALSRYLQAADAFKREGDAVGACDALARAADCHRMLDALDEAKVLIEAAVHAAEAIGEPALICSTKMTQGQVLDDAGERVLAAQVLQQAAELADRDVEEPVLCCNAYLCYGDVLYMIGRSLEAKDWLERAAHLARDELTGTEPSHHRARCNSFVSYGEVLLFLNDERGLEWLKVAARLAGDDACDPHTRCILYKSYGEALRVLGRPGEARAWLEEAWFIAAGQPLDAQTRCHAAMLVGQLLVDLKEIAASIPVLQIAARIADEELKDVHYQCLTYYRYADALRWSEAPEEAEVWLARAAVLADQVPDRHTGCAALRSHAELLGSLGRLAEARGQLERASVLGDEVPDPLLHANLETSWMHLARRERCWKDAFDHARLAQARLLETLGSNRSPKGIAHVLSVYHSVLDVALTAAMHLPVGTADPMASLQLLSVVDGSKCVAIREGLRRHLGAAEMDTPLGSTSWQSGPRPWQHAFRFPAPHELQETQRGLRGAPRELTARPPRPAPRLGEVVELPLGIAEKNRYCQPIDKEGLERILPNTGTAVLHFLFQDDDLIAFAVARDRSGELRILDVDGGGPFRVPNVRDGLCEVIHAHRYQVHDVGNVISALPASTDVDARRLDAQGGTFGAFYRDLTQRMALPALLSWLEDGLGDLDSFHLVVVPDGALYQVPLHALVVSRDGRRLYERFASVRYAVSLRTLELQGVDVLGDEPGPIDAGMSLRGLIFANPAGGLSGVVQEVEALMTASGAERWCVHGDGDDPEWQATRAHFQARHGSGNLLWLMGHGDVYEDAIAGARVIEPGFLLQDGPLSISRLLHDPHDFSRVELLVVSACWLGDVDAALGLSREIESYHAALALRGCRRVVTALWPLADAIAPRFAGHFARALLEGAFGSEAPKPQAFGIAFKRALDAFRADEGGRFDHEYFWAPYTLYGLG